MKISIFENLTYSLWIDYSKKNNCIFVWEINDEELKKIQKWCKFKIQNKQLKIIETEEYKNIKIEELKKEYEEIIIEKYPYYKQINMLAEINEIHLLARQENRNFTAEEIQKVQEWDKMKKWIFSKREKCNDKILEFSN